MLEQLLQYHQKLVPDAFVQVLVARIEKRLQRRLWILGGFAFLGAIAASFAIGSVSQFGWFDSLTSAFNAFNNSGLMLFSALAAMLLVTLLIVWLFNDEVEIY